MGYELGCSGILLDVEEFGRLGLLYLQDGRWNGRQVLPQGWVRQSAAPHAYAVPTSVLPGYEPAQDSVIGAEYGYFIWIGPWGKWYYFSTEAGSANGMLLKSTRTPDGYWVDENGVWIQ